MYREKSDVAKWKPMKSAESVVPKAPEVAMVSAKARSIANTIAIIVITKRRM